MRLIVASSVLLSLAAAAGDFPEVFGTLRPYPGYTGEVVLTGKVKLNGDETTVVLSYLIGGLAKDTTGGIHIHTGYTCDDADLVGGHLWDADVDPVDPWDASLWDSSNPGGGFAKSDFTIENGVGYGYRDNLGRAVVVHDPAGNRVACAVLDNDEALKQKGKTEACFDAYPGYEGEINVEGSAELEGNMGNNKLSWFLKGLPADSTGLIGIYSGTSCADASEIGTADGTGFWSAGDLELSGGAVSGEQNFVDGAIGNYADLVNKVVIVSDADGNGLACGVLNDCAKGSGEGGGSASGLGPGEPVTCEMMSPDLNDGDDFCSGRSNGKLGYNTKKNKKVCHDNVLASAGSKEKKCEPVCCCHKKVKVLKRKKCKKLSDLELQAIPKCTADTLVGEKCEAGGERVPNGGKTWDVNNCGEYDVYEIRCNNKKNVEE